MKHIGVVRILNICLQQGLWPDWGAEQIGWNGFAGHLYDSAVAEIIRFFLCRQMYGDVRPLTRSTLVGEAVVFSVEHLQPVVGIVDGDVAALLALPRPGQQAVQLFLGIPIPSSDTSSSTASPATHPVSTMHPALSSFSIMP